MTIGVRRARKARKNRGIRGKRNGRKQRLKPERVKFSQTLVNESLGHGSDCLCQGCSLIRRIEVASSGWIEPLLIPPIQNTPDLFVPSNGSFKTKTSEFEKRLVIRANKNSVKAGFHRKQISETEEKEESYIEGLTNNEFNNLILSLTSDMIFVAIKICGGDKTAADDMVSETLLRLWKYRGTIKKEGNIRSLVFTALRNSKTSFWRGTKRRGLYTIRISELEGTDIDSDNSNALDDILFRLGRVDREDPARLYSKKTALEELWMKILSLPQGHQDVVCQLLINPDATYEDIASRTPYSRETVATYLKLARKEIRVFDDLIVNGEVN